MVPDFVVQYWLTQQIGSVFILGESRDWLKFIIIDHFIYCSQIVLSILALLAFSHVTTFHMTSPEKPF